MRIIPSIEFIPGKSNVGSALSVIGPDFTFSRTTTPVAGVATRVNASGLIETVPDNVLRLDYPVTGGCPAALIEPAGTNIMAQSETLSVSGNWTQTNVLVTGGAIASPDGLASGTLIVATASSTTHNINRSAATAVASGAVVTTSCFFKAHGTNTFAQLVIGGFAFSPSLPFANFNLSGSGSVTTGTYTSAFIQDYGNGWYRCGFTATAAASGTPNCIIVPIIASGTARNTDFTGDGLNGVYAWGFQVETGAVATTYIPTTTASATRNADVCSVSGVSGYIGQTEGTIYAEVDFRSTIDTTRSAAIFEISDGLTNSNLIRIFRETPNFLRLVCFSGGSLNVAQNAFTLPLGVSKIAVAYQAGSITIYLNGAQQTYTTFVLPLNMNNILFLNTIFPIGNIYRAAAIYTTRLTNEQLQSMTSLSQSYAELASSFSYTVI